MSIIITCDECGREVQEEYYCCADCFNKPCWSDKNSNETLKKKPRNMTSGMKDKVKK